MFLTIAGKVKMAVLTSDPLEVKDFETGELKKNDAGAQLMQYPALLIIEGERNGAQVKVKAPAAKVEQGDVLAFDGLTANYYTLKDGKSGLAFSATAVRKAA